MIKIQCDKNFINILRRFFSLLPIEAEINFFSTSECDICILRDEFLPERFIPSSKFILINSDDSKLIKRLGTVRSRVITCGLSTRSTATLSSISENKGVVCLQRSLVDLTGKKHPQFELPFELSGKIIDDVSVIMIIISALLCGANISQLNKIYL